MIPIQDQNPTSIKPYVNWTLILINVIVFLYTLFNGDLFVESCVSRPESAICAYGLRPSEIAAGAGYITFLTSMFLHADIFHIGGNMLYLWIFGDNIEDQTGHVG